LSLGYNQSTEGESLSREHVIIHQSSEIK